ncbi:MAG: hypothetical protein AUH11_12120 [Acidobacteria bacterium 13_2_20CM_57_17]|nr:MAG: hypothetical protein AUH11_12120 [Acidobacteria bacterium 13_2_20CM_57_17]OLB95607.1 MAG: hypothetical protein AUI02_03370 [Acidobacteria bacterium 13_2_20CM_2_57_12]OLE16043.1 MAG: hypothetical protein AUG83_04515 [Acidobacteria bacterium 13_1_20CM_4_57_11]
MSCCGKSRIPPMAVPKLPISPPGTITFQYTGKTRLTVIGPVTRQRYDFNHTGARVSVDRRDSNSLSTVATLRRV